jgi:hypothetical protein
MILYYDNLVDDLARQIPRIAEFLNIPVQEMDVNAIVRNCSIHSMRSNVEFAAPYAGSMLADSVDFFDKGGERDYRQTLTDIQIERYDVLAEAKLGSECAKWLLDS